MVAEIDPLALAERLAFHPMGTRAFSLLDSSGWLVYRYPPERSGAGDRNWLARYPSLARVLRTRQSEMGTDYDPLHRERP
jgi:hypothetical protein